MQLGDLEFAQETVGGDIVVKAKQVVLPGLKEVVTLRFGEGKFVKGESLAGDLLTKTVPMSGAYGWQDGKLTLVARTAHGPYSMDNTFRFEADGVYVDGCSVAYPFAGENIKLEGSI